MAVDNPTIRNNNRVAVKEEVTAGTYIVPVASDFIQPLEDGFETGFNAEEVERAILTPNIGQAKPRLGTKTSSSTIGVEFKANGTEGAAPESSPLVKGAMGLELLRAADATTAEAASGATQLTLGTHAFMVDDIIMVKIAGNFHITPITAITSTEITLLRPLPAIAPTATVIAAVALYKTANTGHPSLSVTREIPALSGTNIEGVTKQTFGNRVASMAMENFTVGAIPTLAFGMDGLGFNEINSILNITPTFDAALPPIALNACFFKGATQIDVNSVGFSIENTIGNITSTCDANGILANRITERSITGSFTSYLESDEITDFTQFNTNTSFSIFAYAGNPTSTAGEFDDVIAFYLPQCTITEYGEGEQDGVITNEISFAATAGDNGDMIDAILAFI